MDCHADRIDCERCGLQIHCIPATGETAIIIKPIQPLFIRDPSTRAQLTAFILFSLILMMLDHHAGYLNTTRGILSTVVLPLRYAVDIPVRIVSWAGTNLTSRASLIAENDRLHRQHFLNQTKLGKLADLEAENDRLRKLFGASERVGEQVLVAELLAVDMDPFSRRVVLNKGARDGVALGYSLIDTEGIMGQLVEVGPFSSTALLITDPSHALPVQMNRNGFRSIALGTGVQDSLELSHIPNNVEIHIGDTLVTSGLGGRFPPGYPVGTVTQIERDNGQSFAKVLVKPKAQLERNREVLLVRPVTHTPVGDTLVEDMLVEDGGVAEVTVPET
uniref:Cell shape-determining protein MreC n=1 Tax=Candidatus Kentrum eta TaxID=2126337 RepID=A0A450V6Q4_9GAMM|nr:MAG: rod shape-determining protein MreC [Candidatus Kentron sp. H]VFK00458.1 MAG: rod shape-determining protein MreC [Candidatus Kentron sp. H]VFK04567.1 MAG: rod shape-determining protein MreC [Candidatus Kentron sp. H]